MYYGKKRERRYMAVCTKGYSLHHVVVDVPQLIYLNQGAEHAKRVLEYAGFTVHYILNLDTGDKNIFALRTNGDLYYQTKYRLKEATNLIIFYTD